VLDLVSDSDSHYDYSLDLLTMITDYSLWLWVLVS